MRNDTERQNLFSNTSEKISLTFNCEMEQTQDEENSVDGVTRNEREGEERH
jgi:hypothetical protein